MVSYELPKEDLELDLMNNRSSDTLYEQIVEKIRLWILKGYVKEGDSLPSERELAQMFNVSRMPVSQALKVLEYLGVIHYVPRKGVCVKRIDVHNLLSNLGFMIFNPQDEMKDFFDIREVLECHAVQLAAKNRTEKDLENMEEAIWAMERNTKLDRDINDNSFAFHYAIIKAAKNKVLLQLYDLLTEMLVHSFKELFKMENRKEISLEAHKKIYQAIKNQDSKTAESLTMKHLKSVREAVNAK